MLQELGRNKLIILALTFVGVFLLVFTPHFNYDYPLHVDEWHHIDQSISFGNYGEYFESLRNEWEARFTGLEMGFHFFLFLLGFLVDLVTFYKFLPALWATLTAGVLFYIVYRKGDNNFLLGWLAVLFFASIKSNVNITGLWFFTPLTFALPFIFIYIYLFSEGLIQQNKKYILISFLIMMALIPVHSISLLFSIPFLLVLALVYFRFVLKEYLFFSMFLAVPLVGILFYQGLIGVSWAEILGSLFERLQFKYGWGVIEAQNSLSEVYSWVGALLAIIGAIYLSVTKQVKKNLVYILWPIFLAILIIIFRIFGISLFSPYQRNLYYLAISLPFLSAWGVYGILSVLKKYLNTLKLSANDKAYTAKVGFVVVVLLVCVAIFSKYNDLPEIFRLYHPIDESDYKALAYLRDAPEGTILATPLISTASHAVSLKDPYATIYFKLKYRGLTEKFFASTTCEEKQAVLGDITSRVYIISKRQLDCGWLHIYDNKTHIYQLN